MLSQRDAQTQDLSSCNNENRMTLDSDFELLHAYRDMAIERDCLCPQKNTLLDFHGTCNGPFHLEIKSSLVTEKFKA